MPKAVRNRSNFKASDRALFIVENDGTARLLATNKSISSPRGVLPPPKRKATLEEIEVAIARGRLRAAESWRHSNY